MNFFHQLDDRQLLWTNLFTETTFSALVTLLLVGDIPISYLVGVIIWNPIPDVDVTRVILVEHIDDLWDGDSFRAPNAMATVYTPNQTHLKVFLSNTFNDRQLFL